MTRLSQPETVAAVAPTALLEPAMVAFESNPVADRRWLHLPPGSEA